MPTKLNSAGKQQNYVPAGNGDASGEYGDNASGSNKHFQSFKKPSRTSELSKKQIKEIGNYIKSRRGFNDDMIIRSLRHYTGSFGDLSKYTDDELKDMINEFRNLKTSDERVYFKEGGKWKLTYDTGLLEKAGISYYTKEEKKQQEEKDLQKDLTNTKVQQSLYDELKNNGFKGAISLKGINDKNSTDIVNSIKTTINDFSFLNDNLISFGTEKGANALLEQEYRNFIKTPEYNRLIEEYGKKLSQWNWGKTFSKEEIEKNYKTLYFRENKRTDTGKFWGICGPSKQDSRKSWIQLKNSQYGNYDETVNKAYIQKYGYPANVGASFGATTYHELGHAVCNYLLGGKSIFDSYSDTTTVNEIQEIKSKYGKPISYYGMTSIAEYIAECFASHYVDGTNEQANEVYNVLLKKWKGMQK